MKDENLTQTTEFLWRRLSESFSDLVIGLPVLFAFAVLGLMILFRRENRFAGMLLPFVIVTVGSAIYVPLAILFKPVFSWWVVLVPVLLVALFYVCLMYVKDARTIHPAWAGFLGLLRCAVYAILAIVFLLPGCQTFETTETKPKVILLLDVSGSMNTVDDLPEPGQDPSKLPTRQDKVIQALAGKAALYQKVLEKSPITAYRFGSVADEVEVLNLKAGATYTVEQWAKWLRPDKQDIVVPEFRVPGDEKTRLTEEDKLKYRAKMQDLYDSLVSATNVGGSALQIAKAEAGSFVQAIVLFSDGQSNVGSDESVREFASRVTFGKRPIQVFTVGVGEYRQPASIRIDELQAPEIARPDDKFPIRIPVVGPGLPDEPFEVVLEAQRVEDAAGKPVVDNKYVLGPKTGKFQGGGDNPNDTVEFEIDVQDLKKMKADDEKAAEFLEGTWQFVARVPRHAREAFAHKEHVSDPPTRVLVQKKKLRVLLFAGGPGREYQFLRTLLYREVTEKRVEMSVLLQTGRDENVDQDVEADRLLSRFPDRVGPTDPTAKYMSLNDYDAVIAIDPDWTALDVNQMKLLKEWVGKDAGGVIFVAGPVYTYQLARPGGHDISSLLTIYPVVPRDSRLHAIGIGHDLTRPYTLDFGPSPKLFDFLKLDEAGDNPIAGWHEFFWGKGKGPEPGKDAKPLRGVYNYYPVDRIKPGSAVLATFDGPPASRINDGRDPMPYLVTMPYGSGKTVYVGSTETWRLRTYKESFHERFWIKLCRYVAAGTVAQKRFGRILMGRNYPTGIIPVEAQVKGPDMLPLPRDARPTVFVKKIGDDQKPASFDLKAKSSQGDWNGWFMGNVKIKEAGEYEFRIPILGTNETLTHRIIVRKPNIELDNLRNNFGALYQLATEAKDVLNRLPAGIRSQVEKALSRPVSTEDLKDTPGKESGRLFFNLSNADKIPLCIEVLQPRRESVKGRLEDLWDKGYDSGMYVESYWLAALIPLAVGLLGAAILCFLRQWIGAGVFFGASAVLCIGVLILGDPNWPTLPVDFSFVLIVVVTLLSIEWLTRKLLKLA
ncbi:MAG: VWA domain-containing protein [Gemmataceae bacterium]|nr:VWA domain-containing protein [Gemmataceae bacterium]